MAKQKVDAVEFATKFKEMAKAGKSALEIGRALKIQGDDKKVAQYVSLKASQLRSLLRETGLAKAKADGLGAKATKELVAAMVGQLPRLRKPGGPGRKAHVAADVLAALTKLDG